MVSYELTEDYIIEADSEHEAIKLAQIIFDHKQDSQKDLLLQHKVEYHGDIHKKYSNVEDLDEQ